MPIGGGSSLSGKNAGKGRLPDAGHAADGFEGLFEEAAARGIALSGAVGSSSN